MSKLDYWLVVALQLTVQLFEFSGGDVGVGPLKILRAIRLAIAAKTKIQREEMEAAPVKRVLRLFLFDTAQKFLFLQRVHAAIARDGMPVLFQPRPFVLLRLKLSTIGECG